MRVTPSIRTICCVPLMVAGLAAPAVAAVQLDSGTGIQASKEVSTPPPAKGQSAAAVRRSRKSEAQALRAGVGPSAENRGKTAPP